MINELLSLNPFDLLYTILNFTLYTFGWGALVGLVLAHSLLAFYAIDQTRRARVLPVALRLSMMLILFYWACTFIETGLNL